MKNYRTEMSRRNLTGIYTAPAHLLEVEEDKAPQHVASPDDYKKQRFLRKVDMEVKSYKQRMADNLQIREEREKRKRLEDESSGRLENEPPYKQIKGSDGNSQVEESIMSEEGKSGESRSRGNEQTMDGVPKGVEAKAGAHDGKALGPIGEKEEDERGKLSDKNDKRIEGAENKSAKMSIKERIAKEKSIKKESDAKRKTEGNGSDEAQTSRQNESNEGISGQKHPGTDSQAKEESNKNEVTNESGAAGASSGENDNTAETIKLSETNANAADAASVDATTADDTTNNSTDTQTVGASGTANNSLGSGSSNTAAESSNSAVDTAATTPTAVVPVVAGIALTSAVLDLIIPPGYVAVPSLGPALYEIPAAAAPAAAEILPEYDGIAMRPEDVRHFGLLVRSPDSATARSADFRAQDLVFRAKNAAPPARKKAMRALRASVRTLGAPALVNAVVPVMLDPELDEAGRHILTRIVARTAHELGADVRPHVPQLVAAVAPLLIDADLPVRLDAREAVASIARAAGLAAIVSSLRPDLDHPDEYVRNVTARVFAVAAVALGLANAVPFVAAVVRARSANARAVGVRIVRLVCDDAGSGAALVPHADALVGVLRPALADETVAVRTGAAAALARLANGISPHGARAFEPVAPAVWQALRRHRGRALAPFVRCAGAVCELLAHDAAYDAHAAYYTRELVRVVAREFGSADDDVRRTVLAVVERLPLKLVDDVRTTVVEPFVRSFWTRRAALDPAISRAVVAATAHLATVDPALVLSRVVPCARDASEPLRRMAAGAVAAVVVDSNAVVALDARRDEQLVDAVVYAWQSQTEPSYVYLAAVGNVCTALGQRLAPHVPGLVSTVLYRLKSSDPAVRQQAADVVTRVAPVIHECGGADSSLVRKLVLFLYEQLGEAYPEVLGSLVGALHACVATLGTGELVALDNPLVAVLIPTLTPILKNRHDKVQEQCVRMVGLVAQRAAGSVNAKEWMRVGYDLLDMLKSPRRRIRVAANATFGHIAGAIGPADVVAMLLNNLQVQERQMRVCTAVALAIVADTCAPFTVVPALMNEYRVPDKNVQNAVLKAFSFMFEYLDGATSTDYLCAVALLLEDALCDRDQVHRQTAATVVRHLALKCAGRAHDTRHAVFVHLLNLVLPNIMESSPHVISRVLESLDALRIAVGPGIFLNYVWAGLFHAATKVRQPYWKLYNAAYVQHCDAIVPYYPRVGALPNGRCPDYSVDVLDVWL